MAIKFGDTLENQNSNYPIVDISGNNIAGIHFVSSFTATNLEAIPVATRRQGSVLIAQDTKLLYVYGPSDTSNGTNQWNDITGTGWAVQSGDNTLGGDSNFSNALLQDNTPLAISDFQTTTTYTSAIDQLNEVLGKLVPSAPASWASQSTPSFAFSTSSARLVGQTSSGTTLTHDTNGNTGIVTTAGTVVAYNENTAATDYEKTFSFNGNNLALTQFVFSLNDESVQLASASATSATLAAVDNQYGGDMTISVTQGDYPNDGSSSQGFYTGVSSVTVSADAVVNTAGFYKFTIDDVGGNNAGSQTIYIHPDPGTPVGLIALGSSAAMSATGTAGYTSGLPCYVNPTWDLTISTGSPIQNSAFLYGASTDTTDNDCVVFGTGSIITAPANLQYANLPNSTNSIVRRGDAFTNYAINGQATKADLIASINMNTAGGPTVQVKSIFGNSTATALGTGVGDYVYFYDQPSQTSGTMRVFENNLYNTMHTSNTAGYRVTDPDSSGSAVDNPDEATSAYTAWSKQYGNNSSGSLSIKAQDAITAPTFNTINSLRVKHDTTDYTQSGFDFNGTVSTQLNLSGRSSSTAQYVTYVFPCNITAADMTLKFKGNLASGGNLWFKIFDSAAANSMETNGGVNGWVTPTLFYSGSGIAGAAANSGCGDGEVLSTTTTTLQTISCTAGLARWNAGSDNLIYVRIKLASGNYVEQLSLQEV